MYRLLCSECAATQLRKTYDSEYQLFDVVVAKRLFWLLRS